MIQKIRLTSVSYTHLDVYKRQSYVFNNGVCTKKTVGVHVEAECDNLDEYSINSVFIIDPRDSEDEERLYVR